ncbi:NUDIX domain-containing protein [Henriciella sp. AS95]|uniref:NUDIX domain-containing protein n=1 Tax=Henriciella sp. AS95 TaxID=3135782 RepID=UPI00317E9325
MTRLRTRIFQSWFRFSRPKTLGVRAMLEDSEGRVLLVRHTYTSGLFLPGGGVEKGERVEVSLHRELVEEAGATLTGKPHLVGIYSNHNVFPNDHVVLYRIGADLWSVTEPTSRGEISERLWVDPLRPPDDATPGTKRRLAEVYGDGPSDGHW